MGPVGVLRPPGPAAAQVWAQMWAQVWAQVGAQVRALRRQLSQAAGGAPAQISMLSPDPQDLRWDPVWRQGRC